MRFVDRLHEASAARSQPDQPIGNHAQQEIEHKPAVVSGHVDKQDDASAGGAELKRVDNFVREGVVE